MTSYDEVDYTEVITQALQTMDALLDSMKKGENNGEQ